MDEVKDLATAHGGWSSISGAENRFPPLYHLLLNGWLALVPNDSSGRLFSVLCGLATVWIIGRLGATIGGPLAGLWAAALAAVAPYTLWYSLETRPYTLYVLIGSLAIWQWTRAIRTNQKVSWAVFGAAAVAGCFTHYYFALLVLISAIAVVAARPSNRTLMNAAITYACVGVACTPIVFMLNSDLDQPWGFARLSKFGVGGWLYTYFSLLSGYTLGPSASALHSLSPREAAIAAAPWGAVLGIATAILLAMALASVTPNDRLRCGAWFVAFCFLPPIAIGAISRASGFGFSPRHVAWIVAPLFASLGMGIANARPLWLGRIATAILAVGFAQAAMNRLNVSDFRNEDARDAANFIVAEEGGNPRPVFALSGYMRDPLQFYLPANWSVYWLSDAAEGKSADETIKQAAEQIRAETRSGDRFWVAYSRSFHGDPEGAILAGLRREFDLFEIARCPGIVLYRGKR